MRSLCKLLALLVLALMPLGMGAAPAVAGPAHAAQATMPCPDMQDQEPAKHHDGNAPGIAQCTMVCTAALSPPAGALAGNALRPDALLVSVPARDLAGLEPELITPPPRIA